MAALRPLAFVYLVSAVFAADPYCPRYPSAARTEMMESLDLDRDYQQLSRSTGKAARQRAAEVQKANFVDQRLFAKMAADNVDPAPATTDEEFLRRIYLDLTGRIPTPEQATRFLNDSSENKRATLIDELLGSKAYVDQFSTYFQNRFKVTRSHENIGIQGRNVYYEWLRNFVASDRGYDEFVRELLGAEGEVDYSPGTQFFARWMDLAGPTQDSWDDITDKITTSFLGYKTECISCHNGRAHLEKINLYLTSRVRPDFWRQSAFMSRTLFVRWSDDNIGFRPRVLVLDRDYGSYTGAVPQTNPGNRPARANAVIEPEYLTSGKKPQTGRYRWELALMVTGDRQFARATVNYFWDYFFGHGIVDPPDAWDLKRVDPKNPPPAEWPMQNAHPELLEDMADFFMENGYRLRPLIRLLVNTEVYQLSSRYNGVWKPPYVRYFAKHEPRRLSAEQIYDSVSTATHTEQPMLAAGIPRVLLYANQLPDPTEPSTDGRVIDFLNQTGRGNWLTIDRSSEPNILGLLFQMNESQVVYRTLGDSRNFVPGKNRVLEIDAMGISDEEAIRQMFLATLTRYPTGAEVNIVLQRKSGPRAQWLSDLQWTLLNKMDFIFNY